MRIKVLLFAEVYAPQSAAAAAAVHLYTYNTTIELWTFELLSKSNWYMASVI